MQVIPLGQTVLVKLNNKKEKKTLGGIIIPDNSELATEDLPIAVIVAIGPDVRSIIEVGHTVLVSKYAGAQAPDGMRIIPVDQVLAVCSKE